MTAANAISGTGSLIQKGSGELALTGNNSYSGTTTIAAGTLTIGNGGTSGSLGAGAVVNNGVLAFNRSDSVALNTNVSGTGSLVKNGSGTLTIQKMLSYTGGTTVNKGVLVVGYGGANGMIRGNLAIREGAQVTLKGGDSFGYSGGNASVQEREHQWRNSVFWRQQEPDVPEYGVQPDRRRCGRHNGRSHGYLDECRR